MAKKKDTAPATVPIKLVRPMTGLIQAKKARGLFGVAEYLKSEEPITANDREYLALELLKLSRRLDSRQARDRDYAAQEKEGRGSTKLSGRPNWNTSDRLALAVALISASRQHGHTAKDAHERTASTLNAIAESLGYDPIYKSGESLRQAIKDWRRR